MLLGGGSDGAASATSSVAAPRATAGFPPSNDQIDALLRHPLDLGELADPQRRASCLSGLGYSASTSVLGGRPAVVDDRPAVLMLLPGDAWDRLKAVVVTPECSAMDSGLLVASMVARP
jgi:hypothetical protein